MGGGEEGRRGGEILSETKDPTRYGGGGAAVTMIILICKRTHNMKLCFVILLTAQLSSLYQPYKDFAT